MASFTFIDDIANQELDEIESILKGSDDQILLLQQKIKQYNKIYQKIILTNRKSKEINLEDENILDNYFQEQISKLEEESKNLEEKNTKFALQLKSKRDKKYKESTKKHLEQFKEKYQEIKDLRDEYYSLIVSNAKNEIYFNQIFYINNEISNKEHIHEITQTIIQINRLILTNKDIENKRKKVNEEIDEIMKKNNLCARKYARLSINNNKYANIKTISDIRGYMSNKKKVKDYYSTMLSSSQIQSDFKELKTDIEAGIEEFINSLGLDKFFNPQLALFYNKGNLEIEVDKDNLMNQNITDDVALLDINQKLLVIKDGFPEFLVESILNPYNKDPIYYSVILSLVYSLNNYEHLSFEEHIKNLNDFIIKCRSEFDFISNFRKTDQKQQYSFKIYYPQSLYFMTLVTNEAMEKRLEEYRIECNKLFPGSLKNTEDIKCNEPPKINVKVVNVETSKGSKERTYNFSNEILEEIYDFKDEGYATIKISFKECLEYYMSLNRSIAEPETFKKLDKIKDKFKKNIQKNTEKTKNKLTEPYKKWRKLAYNICKDKNFLIFAYFLEIIPEENDCATYNLLKETKKLYEPLLIMKNLKEIKANYHNDMYSYVEMREVVKVINDFIKALSEVDTVTKYKVTKKSTKFRILKNIITGKGKN